MSKGSSKISHRKKEKHQQQNIRPPGTYIPGSLIKIVNLAFNYTEQFEDTSSA